MFIASSVTSPISGAQGELTNGQFRSFTPSSCAQSGQGETMGYSQYDRLAQEGRPWNAGRNIGATRALKPKEFNVSFPRSIIQSGPTVFVEGFGRRRSHHGALANR